MRTFKDNQGRPWDIDITIGTLKQIKQQLALDLLDLLGGKPSLLERLTTDVVLVIDLIYICCKRQADDRKVTDEDFARSLGADAAIAAQDALVAELSDFFRSLRRNHLAGAISKQQTVLTKAVLAATNKVDLLDPDEIVERAMTSGATSTDAPPSSDSTPAP